MRIHLQYGRGHLPVDLPAEARVTVIEPRFVPGLPDEPGAFREALRQPYGTRPLRDLIASTDRLAVVIPDYTRALPRERLLTWLFAELSHLPEEQVVILNGTGTHRGNTPEELERMLGADLLRRFRVINHDASDASSHALAGHTPDGRPVFYNRHYVEADRRIVLGFIEPHLWAGFSGGYKGVFPGIADLASIQHYHRPSVIADPRSIWGRTEENPTLDQVRLYGSLLPIDFLVNVTLNREQRITGFFCGETAEAHAAGCAFARRTAMVELPHPFPLVLTSNSGFPLDQNLYQATKGMSAAAQICSPGGLILAAAECSDGFPAHGNFRTMALASSSPQELLDRVFHAPAPFQDMWQIQLFGTLLTRFRIGLHSLLPDDDVRRAHLEPVPDLSARIRAELANHGPGTPVAVLPEGPMTIPCLAAG